MATSFLSLTKDHTHQAIEIASVEVSKLLTSGNKFELVFILYHPDTTLEQFQVTLAIYENKFGQ